MVVDFMRDQIDSSLSIKQLQSRKFAMNLKSQLNYFLKLRGMTAAELGRKSGVSKQVLSIWLGGAEPKKLAQIKAVAAALGTTVDHLCFGEGEDRESQRVTELDALLGEGWVSGLFEVRFRRIRRPR